MLFVDHELIAGQQDRQPGSLGARGTAVGEAMAYGLIAAAWQPFLDAD
jgi:hypothetical protein